MEIIIKPEDFIAKEYLVIYKKEHDVIYKQLVKIKNNLIVTETILNFPFELFAFKGPRDFWNLTQIALFDSTILAIWTISHTKGDFTLRRFKNKITKEWKRSDIDPTTEKILREQLDDVDFKRKISDIHTQINKVRNHHIAHMDYNSKLELGNKDQRVQYWVDIKDMKTILKALHDFFVVLSFDVYPSLELWDHVPRPNAKNHTTGIDDLLTFVASQSMYLTDNHPSAHSIHVENQQDHINRLSDENQATVKEWRGRVNRLFPK